jgi:hypothetical protein
MHAYQKYRRGRIYIVYNCINMLLLSTFLFDCQNFQYIKRMHICRFAACVHHKNTSILFLLARAAYLKFRTKRRVLRAGDGGLHIFTNSLSSSLASLVCKVNV